MRALNIDGRVPIETHGDFAEDLLVDLSRVSTFSFSRDRAVSSTIHIFRLLPNLATVVVSRIHFPSPPSIFVGLTVIGD